MTRIPGYTFLGATLILLTCRGLAPADGNPNEGAVLMTGHNLMHRSADCCPSGKVCVAVPGKKKTTKVVYETKTEDYCLPHCSLSTLFSRRGCCGGQGCASCTEPRRKTVLIKKIITVEEDTTTCVIQSTAEAVQRLPVKTGEPAAPK